jgi:putative dimethyl sulfoxide reductase chaperone
MQSSGGVDETSSLKGVDVQTVSLDEQMDRLQARGLMYALLSISLEEPTPSLIHDWLAGNLVAAFRETSAVLPGLEVEPVLAEMERSQSEQDGRPEDTVQSELNLEHLRLFVGPGHVPCPPYESVYLENVPADQRGLLMGDAAVDVRNRYRAAGLDMVPGHVDLPDHMSTELEFMHFQCQKELEAWSAGDERQAQNWSAGQREFLMDHLKVWTPAFCEALLAATENGLYRGLAVLCRAYVASE